MPTSAPAPSALLFDLDDTLLDDRAASSAGLRAVMERLGHPDFGAARRLWDVQTDISFGAYLNGRLSLEEQRRERIRALAVQAGHLQLPDQHCDELYRIYLEAHRASWQAFADVFSCLGALATAGFKLGVVTNGVEAMQHAKLAALELTPYFHTVVCADTAGVGKPDPRIFHLAAQRLAVDPRACWHVGDQMHSDAIGAVAAQMRPVLIDRHGHQEQYRDVTGITGLEELLRLVGLSAPAPAGSL